MYSLYLHSTRQHHSKWNEIRILPRSVKAQSRKLTLILVVECTELVLSLNLSAVSSFSLQKFATQLASCSPNRSHCLSDTPSTLSRLSVVDGLRSKITAFQMKKWVVYSLTWPLIASVSGVLNFLLRFHNLLVSLHLRTASLRGISDTVNNKFSKQRSKAKIHGLNLG